MANHFLGIDLGTSNSSAAVFDGRAVQVIRNAQGSPLTPSVVRIDARGQLTVGAKARRFLETDGANTKSEFKRLMGTTDALTFKASGQTRRPEQLAAEVLKSLRLDVKEQLGFNPTQAVISVPALFELPQSSATALAAEQAGFERVELIQEPVASAIAAGWTRDAPTETWLVYDLGGGTFDASIVQSRDGVLTVVGHDGDNFLGGRDFDWAVVDAVLELLSKSSGVSLRRDDPAVQSVLPRLKWAVEEAKIELSRASSSALLLPEGLVVNGQSIEVDVPLTADELNRLCAPLIDRSIRVVQRLLTTHGLQAAQVARMVLVGGPTAMPGLRGRLKEALAIPFAEGLDPMTLVAQGAALFAASAGVVAAPQAAAAPSDAVRFFLQHPAMSADRITHVVGKRADDSARVTAVELARADGGFTSERTPLSDEGAFATSVTLKSHSPNEFSLRGFDAAGNAVPVHPSTLTIVQGVTLHDPPLSRSIGVALADNDVQVYFERGSPLPIKRSFRHVAVETLIRGDSTGVLRIPIVQGEFPRAHLCRLVGHLQISAAKLTQDLPLGSPLEVTVELDRGGRLVASARIEATGQIFDRVDALVVASDDPKLLAAARASLEERLEGGLKTAATLGLAIGLSRLSDARDSLDEVDRDIAAAVGGDKDAALRARRALQDLERELESVELEGQWPQLANEGNELLSLANVDISSGGTEYERRQFEQAAEALQRAHETRNVVDFERRLRQIRLLRRAINNRTPEAWVEFLDYLASRVSEASDIKRANELVAQGRALSMPRDLEKLKKTCTELHNLLPAEERLRRLSHSSGVR